MGLRFLCVAGGVGRGNWRLHCWVRTPPRKIHAQVQEHKHTSFPFLVVTFYELRLDGVLRSSSTNFVLQGTYCAKAHNSPLDRSMVQSSVLIYGGTDESCPFRGKDRPDD